MERISHVRELHKLGARLILGDVTDKDSLLESVKDKRRARAPLVIGVFFIALPGWMTSVIGAALTALVVTVIILIRRRTTRWKGEAATNHWLK